MTARAATERFNATAVWKSIAEGRIEGDQAFEAGVIAFADFLRDELHQEVSFGDQELCCD